MKNVQQRQPGAAAELVGMDSSWETNAQNTGPKQRETGGSRGHLRAAYREKKGRVKI